MKVGDIVILKANPVYENVEEPVEILAKRPNGYFQVEQLTWANGEPGVFDVRADELAEYEV